MKKIAFIGLLSLTFWACNSNTEETTDNTNLTAEAPEVLNYFGAEITPS